MSEENRQNSSVSPAIQEGDRLLLQAHFEEYKALQAEIQLRLEAQQTLLNITIALVAGTLAAIVGSIQSGLWDVLLLVPIMFLIIAWWYLGYNNMIGQTARYIHGELTPSVKSILERSSPKNVREVEKVWNWLAFQYRDFVKTTGNIYALNAINLVKYLPWIFPSGLALGVFMYLQYSNQKQWQAYQMLFFAIDVTLWLTTLILMVFVLGWQPWPDIEGKE